MNYIKIDKECMNNGEGIRVVLWVAGCEFKCPGCHNQDSWDFEAGEPFTVKVFKELLELVSREHIQGLTILGGEPLHPKNLNTVYYILKAVKENFPEKDTWLWTGYNYFEIPDAIIKNADYIIDGRYDEKKKATLKWRGSSNQNIYHQGKKLDI